MANTDTQERGIYAWMASVRASMANDPCRQLFEDQVQTHAFIFLDDYLEHILAGPKQAPIIELVKTPGRKRNVPRRTKATTAKVKNTLLSSLDCDNSAKEAIPVNSFHKALLQAKERSAQDALETPEPPANQPSTPTGSVEMTHGHPKSVEVADIPQTTLSIEPESQTGLMPLQHSSENPVNEVSAPFPISQRGTQLSVIVEGDESPERTHASFIPSFTIASNTERILSMRSVLREPLSDGRHPVSSHHSIPLDSPREVLSSGTGTSNHTDPLPSRSASNSPNYERNAFTAPLPVVPVPNLIPHTICVPLNDLSPKVLPPKSGIAAFPMIPAPSPLHKSTHVAQDAPIGPLPAPAPAPVPLGKRTSWLMKAREAKAMEGTSSLPSASMPVTSGLTRRSTAVKRKSGEMLGALPPGPDLEKDQRKSKVAKSTEVVIAPPISGETAQHTSIPAQGEPTVLPTAFAATGLGNLERHGMDVEEQTTCLNSTEEGFIDLFKRTVEGLGARAGKSMGRSLGGAAVAALAEARAAAEAKVAERNKVNGESGESGGLRNDDLPDQEPSRAQAHSDDEIFNVPVLQARGVERRLSLSDLGPDAVQHDELEIPKTIQATDVGNRINSCDESVSTTPPHSPPLKGGSGFLKPAGPVFNKPAPPPVFIPPASKQSSISSALPEEFPPIFPPGQFALPLTVPIGIPARLTSPSDDLPSILHGAAQISVLLPQSSNSNFDKVPTWCPSTQDTPCSAESELLDVRCAAAVDDDDDDDDSWPLEEKLAVAEPGWRPFDFSNVDKEDTWSSLPTESQGPTRSITTEKNGDVMTSSNITDVGVEANDGAVEREQEVVEISDAERLTEASEPEEVAEPVTGLRCRELTARNTSQTSIISTASSSQSQVGFFGQATKLVNSMLGGGKRAKPELKSLQIGAGAAKKQQQEADRKTQRLKETEARRQAAVAKKAEDERIRLLEDEAKRKEEIEKRKREREENADRRPPKLPVPVKKTEDETSKKRKLVPELEKKSESKKPPPKDRRDPAPPTKSVVIPATKPAAQRGPKAGATAPASSTTHYAIQNPPPAPVARPIIPEAKPFKVVLPSLKGKAKAGLQQDDMGDKLPSAMVQSQMAARAKAQMQAAKLPTPEVPSESIELPEINSEYSDSEDEDRVRAFDPPDWAQSPELRQALERQSTVNPDDIFGAIQPLQMEEMFRARSSRFRARTSSANWSGSDKLTIEEIREYERRMGFQQTQSS